MPKTTEGNEVGIGRKSSSGNFSFYVIAGTIALVLIALISTSQISNKSDAGTEFVIEPKIGNVDSGTFEDLGTTPLVLKEGESFTLKVSSNLPNPPVQYLYDNNGDGTAEMPFRDGDSATFTMYRSDPLPKVCQLVSNGETCKSKIVGIDNAGNSAEYAFISTTIYG